MVVYTTAVQAGDCGIPASYLRDASTTGTDPRAKQADAAVLEAMAPRIALVTTTDDAIAHLP